MESPHPTKFGDHKYCSRADTMFLMFEEQNSTCLFKSAITIYL